MCTFLKNKFLYSCSIVFSWYCTLSFLFKTTFQLSRHNHNSQIKPPMTYLKFLCRSHLLFFLPRSLSFTILRSPPSIHTPTAVPPFNPQPNHSPTLNCFLKQITAARTIDAIVHVGRIQRRVLVAQYFHRLLPSNAPEEKTKRHQRLSAQ